MSEVKTEVKVKDETKAPKNAPKVEDVINASLKDGAKDAKKEGALVLTGSAALAVYNAKGVEALPENVVICHGDVESTNIAEAKAMLRQYVRAKILRQFGVKAERNNGKVVKMEVKPLFINGICRPLKLEAVETDKNGLFLEEPNGYLNRNKKAIMLWLVTSIGVASAEKLAKDII